MTWVPCLNYPKGLIDKQWNYFILNSHYSELPGNSSKIPFSFTPSFQLVTISWLEPRLGRTVIGFRLWFKKLDGRGNKKWRGLLSICKREVRISHGLAFVPVDRTKFNPFQKRDSGILTHRPFTICAEGKECLRNSKLHCHVVDLPIKSTVQQFYGDDQVTIRSDPSSVNPPSWPAPSLSRNLPIVND